MAGRTKAVKENEKTINSLILIIKEINNEIDFLIKTSSEDFLALHSNFTYIYKFISDLITGIKSETDFYSDEENLKFIREAQKMMRMLNKESGRDNRYIQKLIEIYNNLERTLDCLFLAANNFNQDLKTLKLLSANLKLDPVTLHLAYALDRQIRIISQSSANFIYQIKLLLDEIKKSKSALHSFNNSNTDPVSSVANNIARMVDLFGMTYKKCNDFKPLLKEMIKRSSESSSAIITQLQYQDIVKQKIEHIEQAYNEIIKKLENISEPENAENSDIIAFLLQLKDISELQASQLVFANKEYQNALQIINEKYLDLIELVDKILKRYRNACSGQPEENAYNKNTGIKPIQYEVSGLINTIDSILSININTISEKMHLFQDTLLLQKNTCRDIAAVISANNDQKAKTGNVIYNQVHKVVDNLEKNNELLEYHLSDCLEQSSNIEWLKQKMYAILSLEAETINKYNSRHIGSSRVMPEDLKELPGDLIKTVQEVKYYRVFNLEIEKIIDRLNKIAEVIQVEVTLQESDNQEVELLKKRYTVGSEHIIHNEFSKKKAWNGGFSDENKISNDNNLSENSIELF